MANYSPAWQVHAVGQRAASAGLEHRAHEGPCDSEPLYRPQATRSVHMAGSKAADEPKTRAATNSSSREKRG